MLPKEAIKAFSGIRTPKFIATANSLNIPNIVPVISTMAIDSETIVFGEFMINKTKKNLQENRKLTVLVMTDKLDLWIIRGSFIEFQEKGDYLDELNKNPMFQYNAYMRISRAAVIKVEEVVLHKKLSMLKIAKEFLKVKAVSKTAKKNAKKMMPEKVMEKFARIKSVRVFSAMTNDGYPDAMLTMSMMPHDSSSLLFSPDFFKDKLSAIPVQSPVAASVITFDPVAYQVKGTWQGIKSYLGINLASMHITEVYSACPPLPGVRIEPSL